MFFYATIRHHSVARAPMIAAGTTLHSAKCRASREFGDGFLSHEIIIFSEPTPDRPDGLVARKRVGDRRWITEEAR